MPKTLQLGETLPATQDDLDEDTRVKIQRQEASRVGPAIRHVPFNSAEEPTQAATTTRVRSAIRQYVQQLPASRSAFNSTVLRAASTSLGTACAPFSVLPASPALTMKTGPS